MTAPGASAVSTFREPLVVFSELFDEIGCGTITLSVPLKDDVIQMGVRNSPDRGTLRVHKGLRTATVERTDGVRLQAEIVLASEMPAGSPEQDPPTLAAVFHQPVQNLRLRRLRHKGILGWEIAATLAELCDPAHVAQFINVIGAFGAAKPPSGPCSDGFGRA